MKTLAFAALLGLAGLAGRHAARPAWAQAPAPPTHFDAASIQPAPPMRMGRVMIGLRFSPGRIMAQNTDLKSLIETAFDLKPYQVQGPRWMSRERFNVTAEVQQPLGRDAMAALLQPFLIQQFGLVTHRASKTVNIYALEVNGGKPKMTAAAPGAKAPNYMSFGPNGATLSGTGTMGDLAGMLSRQVDRPVVDFTELKGTYKYTLRYMPGSESPMFRLMRNLGMRGPGGGPGGRGGNDVMIATARGGAPGGAPPGPKGERGTMDGQDAGMPAVSIFSALPQQLGLKLVPRKGPITILVVDHANQKPKGN